MSTDALALELDQFTEVSVVMPCLNEVDTVAACTEKAQQALRDHNIRGEVIVADNGSTDWSRDWRVKDFGNLDYTATMRLVVPGVTLTALGVQTLLAGFLLALVRVPPRGPASPA